MTSLEAMQHRLCDRVDEVLDIVALIAEGMISKNGDGPPRATHLATAPASQALSHVAYGSLGGRVGHDDPPDTPGRSATSVPLPAVMNGQVLPSVLRPTTHSTQTASMALATVGSVGSNPSYPSTVATGDKDLADRSRHGPTAHRPSGITTIAHSSNPESHGQHSQATASSMDDNEDPVWSQLRQNSQRNLVTRLQARLGLRHKSDEVTAEGLHTAMWTLGIEQFEIQDYEELLVEIEQHQHLQQVSSRTSSGGRVAASVPGLKRQPSAIPGTAAIKRLRRAGTVEQGGKLPFRVFATFVMGNRNTYDRMSAKGAATLKVVREILLCSDANRLVAELAQVRVDDLAAPSQHVSWKGRFEALVGLVIIVNGILIGVEQDMDFVLTIHGPWFWMDLFFTVFFFMEMVVKLIYSGCREHFCGTDWTWNIFDDFLVLLAVADSLVAAFQRGDEVGTSTFTVIRVFRLTRVTRLFRIFQLRHFRELALMVKGLFAGMRTLFWAIVLLFFAIYIFAVLTSALIKLEKADAVIAEERLFADVPQSMFTAFRCFVGDCQDSQGRSVAKLMADQYGWPFVVGYLIATVFVTFGLFNLIFAIYIENTLQAARASKSTHLERYKESLRIAHVAKSLLKKFCSAYRAGEEIHKVGTIKSVLRQTTDTELEDVHMKVSKELFMLVIQDPEVQRLMDDLDIPPDRAALFDILDADGSGGLEAAELIQGFLRVRGEARKSDVVASVLAVRAAQDMIREVKRTQDQVHDLARRILDTRMQELKESHYPDRHMHYAPHPRRSRLGDPVERAHVD
eukprot:CAMPEP_0178373204 /NCGR_PEP_ID=MMETSP0689_2-20121128/1744_1 /TAXON_ID=160604 /ORGANISM="Amphidinium massartii, Strain CS-259" /LENGTH=796 /DNA_ID=CAMNT_0019993143 /DNA_START=292 /DNA_END=2682 /DNA_ORIENTATION=+